MRWGVAVCCGNYEDSLLPGMQKKDPKPEGDGPCSKQRLSCDLARGAHDSADGEAPSGTEPRGAVISPTQAFYSPVADGGLNRYT